MADGKLPLSPASPGGQIEDVEQINVPNPVPPPPGPGLIALVRQRVQTVGRLYNQIAAVLDADPAPAEFGLVTRGVDAAKETTLAAISLLQLPAALIGGRFDVNIGSWLGSTAPTVGQKTMAASVPVVIASDQSAIGTHGNAWNAVAVLAGGVSNSIDTQYTPHISIFGSTSGNTTISVQLSQDNVNFYDADSFNNPGGGDFGYFNTIGARYVRLKSSAARTITATVAGKD